MAYKMEITIISTEIKLESLSAAELERLLEKLVVSTGLEKPVNLLSLIAQPTRLPSLQLLACEGGCFSFTGRVDFLDAQRAVPQVARITLRVIRDNM